jgi:subtilisin family serine protease
MLRLVSWLLALGHASSADFKKAPPGKSIPSQYIVRLNPELSAKDVHDHAVKLTTENKDNSQAQVIYSDLNPDFLGYSAPLSPIALENLLRDNLVSSVEEDQVVDINTCIQQSDADWGLRRVSNADFVSTNPSKYEYIDGFGGQNVDVYILDTGIYCEHDDFTSKATGSCSFGASFVYDSAGKFPPPQYFDFKSPPPPS